MMSEKVKQLTREEIKKARQENALIKQRIEKLEKIKAKGINPYPYNYDVTDFSEDILKNQDKCIEEEKVVKVAGRLKSFRRMGKTAFMHIEDKQGKIQAYVRRDILGEDEYELVKLLDLGDIVGVAGKIFITKTGEASIKVEVLTMLSKSIRPLPVVKEKDGKIFDAFNDKELRYRNRHMDLIVTAGVKETFIKRIKIIKNVKAILDNKEFLEVETPILQPIYGGAAARPFTTEHNALSTTFYMRISLEPYLKKLIVGGLDRVYEISKVFRNEGIDKTHNPEFTLLEFYQAYADFKDMMDITEEIFEQTALKVNGSTKTVFDGNEIELKAPWRRIKMVDAIKEYTEYDVMEMSDEELQKVLENNGAKIKGEYNRGLAINEIFEMFVEDKLIQPTFVTHHPVETSPLCKVDYDDPRFLQRFELFINGKEFANAYSELNDPIFQRKTLEEQSKRRDVDDEASPMDENFVQAIEVGMPPTAGIGIGIDRLVMLLTGETSIRDILLFPTMKPEGK